jgi:hypothetical protein
MNKSNVPSNAQTSSPDIKVLTWNICWGCMSANETSKNDSTARLIASRCAELNEDTSKTSRTPTSPSPIPTQSPPIPTSPTPKVIYKNPRANICLLNVIKLINNRNYDIIGLQEIVNSDIIRRNIYNYNNYEYIHNIITRSDKDIDKDKYISVNVELVTFINKKKFKIIHSIKGDLNRELPNASVDARPYHIIFLEYNTTKQKLIVINLHNGKKMDFYTKSGLAKTFTDATKKLPATIILDEYTSIINIGDFNDNQDTREDFYKGYTPIPNINVSSKNKVPPNTCCRGKPLKDDKGKLISIKGAEAYTYTLDEAKDEENLYTKLNGNDIINDLKNININIQKFPYYGDYILISDNLTYKQIPSIIDTQKTLSSDHLAVDAIINFDPQTKQQTEKLKYLKYKNKYLKLKKLINSY